MSEDPVSPWPLCLGNFDEESCRYFLHELGTRLVPSFPFSFGMEEAYGAILDKYGFDDTPDVTSLLQELLEDEYNATGLGDDGDVWRSWRHGWRHRNDDTLNPFIPRFGSIVLRPSTTPRIRQFKANNFSIQFEKQEDCRNVPTEVSQEILCRPSMENMNKNLHFQIQRHSNEPLIMSQELKEDDTPAHTVSSANLGSCVGMLPERKMLKSFNSGDLLYPGMIESGTLVAEIEKNLSDFFENIDPSSCDAAQLRGGDSVVDQLHRRMTTVTETRSSSAAECGQSLSSPGCGNRPNCTVGQVNASPLSPGTPSQHADNDRERVANREAQLIDGTIFISKCGTSAADGQHCINVPDITQTPEKQPSRSDWLPIKRRSSTRSNWVQEFSRLLTRRQSKQSATHQKHHSFPVPKSTRPLQQISRMSISKDTKSQDSRATYISRPFASFGFDGTTDESSCTSPAYLNKPLPLNPDEIVRSMSNRSQITSQHSQHSDSTLNLPSASSVTSSVSRTSSKKDFRGLTRELLNCEMLTTHELPPIQEFDAISKDVVDPLKSPAPPASRVSYSSIAQGNPYLDTKPKSPTRPPPLDFSKLLRKDYDVEELARDPQPPSNYDAKSIGPQQTDGCSPCMAQSESATQDQKLGRSESTRGRSQPSSTSPTQLRKENLPPKTPTKRSRSPFKRLLGLSKSATANKLEEAESVPQPTTPGSTKKESLKRWGDRFRYGFLTPDQEQLRQEELIEAHNNDSSHSTPQNSTFPVSLEPPIQAKIQSEIELIMIVTANRYLLHEARAGRISAESVARTKEIWEKMNRPQVIEFHYDQLTQHSLVMANLGRVKLYGDAAKDAIAINSTMRGWKILAREMSVRTFCSPDSVIRKHLHDAHRVLELLGAPVVTFYAFEDMQLKTLAKISQRQKERLEKRTGSVGRDASGSGNMLLAAHRRNASEGSYKQQQHDYSDYPVTALQMDKISLSPSPTPLSKNKVRKATGAEGAIMSLPTNFEKARDNYATYLRGAKMSQTMKEI